MRKGIILLVSLALIVLAAACTTTPTSPAQPTAPRIAASTPAAVPSDTPAASATTALSPSVAPTTPIPTSTPAPPTPVIPAGLYITSLDIVPDPPTRGANLLFYATFANTTGIVQNFRWIVYLYRSDNPLTSFGETTVTMSSLPLGAQTEQSLGFWKLPLGGPCENFVARVAWLDQNNQSTPFLRPDGQVFEKPITVCAPSDLPTATPALPSQPTPIPTPPPGLFVTDLRTDPNPPTRGSDVTFYPTFSNTTNAVQNYRWTIYISTAVDPAHRISETSTLQTAFPVGVSEQKSLGSWKAPVIGPCEDFLARVVWFDQYNRANQFIKPDGSGSEKTLTVCPP